jgi:prepilin-type N-terminal cleavage/methylation domain-containing protein
LRSKREKNRGFTIIELMVVIGIVCALAGLLFPVLAYAKVAAKRTDAISNLHQCYISMQLYAPEEAFPLCLPDKPVLEPYLGNQITCDPSDTWRSSCQAASTAFTIGSFGYVRTISQFSDDQEWSNYCRLADGAVPVMISPFYPKPVGRIDTQPQKFPYEKIDEYWMPSTMLTMWASGKIGMAPVLYRFPGQLFTWDMAFCQIQHGRG